MLGHGNHLIDVGDVLAQGFDITPDLRRMCPSLTLQQIYKLTEHHHDDWITGSQTTDILVLLQTLKRIVDNTVRCLFQHETPSLVSSLLLEA